MKEEDSSGPRYRRWILRTFFGLAIVGFSPFFIPDPAPPFEFLKGAHIESLYINNDDEEGGDHANYSYTVHGDFASLVKAARAELKAAKFYTSGPEDDVSITLGKQFMMIAHHNYGTPSEPITYVWYEHPASRIERLRAFVRSLNPF